MSALQSAQFENNHKQNPMPDGYKDERIFQGIHRLSLSRHSGSSFFQVQNCNAIVFHLHSDELYYFDKLRVPASL